MAMRSCLFAFLLIAIAPAFGAPEDDQARIDPDVMTEGFLAAHPDLRWRGEGVRAYQNKEYGLALTQLQRAARYGDKPSQAMIGEMYWEGIGVARDRELGYAWMDIAAERMYIDFLADRERYWEQLGETERRNAVERGQAILAEYGDDVAKPRLEKVLRRARRGITGSHAGFVGNLTIIPATGPLAGTGMTLRGDQYYAPKYWQPEKYWQLQDEIWRAPLKGKVNVGDVETVEASGPEQKVKP